MELSFGIPVINSNYAFTLVLTFNSKNNSWKYLKFKVISNIFKFKTIPQGLKENIPPFTRFTSLQDGETVRKWLFLYMGGEEGSQY